MSKEKSDQGKKTKGASYANLLGMNPPLIQKNTSKDKSSKGHDHGDRKRNRSQSPKEVKKSRPENSRPKKDEYVNYDVPDRSFGDLFCKICDSHMNSEGMWTAHIIGKRHLKNTKNIGEAEQKYEYLDEPPLIHKELERESVPIVGLQHICEIRRLEQKPIYQCFLCSGNVPSFPLLIEHVVGLKHRLAFLKEHDPNRHKLIEKSELKKGNIEQIVEECVAKHEADFGRGSMVVKQEKTKTENTWKKSGFSRDSKSKDSPANLRDYPSSSRDHPTNSRDYPGISRDYSITSHHGGDRMSDYRDSDRKQISGLSRYPEMDDYRLPDREREYSSPYSSRDKWYPEDDRREREQDGNYRDSDHRGTYGNIDSTGVAKSLYYQSSSQLGNVSSSTHNQASVYANIDTRSGDLREVIEQKKALEYNRQSQSRSEATENTASVNVDISDRVLGIFSSLPAVTFFQLVLFKLDNLQVESELEIKLLDRVANKTATMSADIKTRLMTPTLRAQFEESMIQNGIGIKKEKESYSEDIKKLMDFIGDYRAQSDHKSQNAIKTSSYKASSSKSLQIPKMQSQLPNVQSASQVSTATSSLLPTPPSSTLQSLLPNPPSSTLQSLLPNPPSSNLQSLLPTPPSSNMKMAPVSYPHPFSQPTYSSISQIGGANSVQPAQNNASLQWSPAFSTPFSSSSSSSVIPGLTYINDETNKSTEQQGTANINPMDKLKNTAKDILGYLPYSTKDHYQTYGNRF